MVGVEALVRWMHPQRGLIAPAAFLPLAEETGLILALDWWVMETACRQLRCWQEHYPHAAHLTLNLNMSPKQFAQADFVDRFTGLLQSTEVNSHAIVLEMTETAMMSHGLLAAHSLQQLQRQGIRLALDDFGTGYSSLSYLHQFPIDIVKIDRSFVRTMEEEARQRTIVQTIIAMAQTLEMQVVAEGIEIATQWEYLHALQCLYGQGYYFARPMDTEHIQALLEQWRGCGSVPLMIQCEPSA